MGSSQVDQMESWLKLGEVHNPVVVEDNIRVVVEMGCILEVVGLG